MKLSVLFNKYGQKPSVKDTLTHRETKTGTDSQDNLKVGKDSDSYNRQKMEDRVQSKEFKLRFALS